MKISSKNIAEALYASTKGKTGNELALTLKHGVKILSKKRLLGQSQDIMKALQNIIDKKDNVVRAKIITAKSLSSEEKKKVEHQIKEKYKVELIVSEFFENSDLLGGMRIEVKDEVLDTTYKNKLQRLEKFLIKK